MKKTFPSYRVKVIYKKGQGEYIKTSVEFLHSLDANFTKYTRHTFYVYYKML